MSNVFNLKLYRKFLILSILVGGLFFVSSLNKTSAASQGPCCGLFCDANYDACESACYAGDPRKLNKCLDTCNDESLDCYIGPPACNSSC